MMSLEAAGPRHISRPTSAGGDLPDVAKAVGLSGKTWAGLGGTFGTALVAAVGWANSMKTDLGAAINKLDSATEKLAAIDHRLEKYEDRLRSLELQAAAKRNHRDTSSDEDGSGGGS